MTTQTLSTKSVTLIGSKAFGNWGVSGFDYGIIVNVIEDSFGKDITIQWEDGRTKIIDAKEVTIIEENTDIDNVGFYIDVTGEYLGKEVTINTGIEERSPETISINSKLQIVKLSNQKFYISKNSYIMPTGYAFYHPTLGFYSIKGDKQPYTPRGGKKALQSILDAGGMLNFDDSVWWLPRV